MQEEFHEVVAEERERGTTILLSSHDLDEVERLCDRVAIIRAGRLVAVEHVADLTRRRFRHVMVEFAQPPERRRLRRARRAFATSRSRGCRARFGVDAGALDAVVKALARHAVVDLELAHPSLEEIFLTYYESDPEDAR